MIPIVVHWGIKVYLDIRGERVAITSFVGRRREDVSVTGFGLKYEWINRVDRRKTRFFFEEGSVRLHRPADFYRARKIAERLIPALALAREKMRPIEPRALRACLDLVTRPEAELPHGNLRKIARYLTEHERVELVNALHSLNLESTVLWQILQDTRLAPIPQKSGTNGTAPLKTTGVTRYLNANSLPNSS